MGTMNSSIAFDLNVKTSLQLMASVVHVYRQSRNLLETALIHLKELSVQQGLTYPGIRQR